MGLEPVRPVPARSRIFPWAVFTLAFGLLISDHMSRQVLPGVFPFVKREWTLPDASLATLGGVVALTVGILTMPLSILADRWGRVRSLVLMALLWSVATLLCALASGYDQMLGARVLVGVGEAAYGSVGVAVVLGVFAPRFHAALGGAFMAGACFGSTLGVAVGGLVALQLGWRWSFAVVAVFGLVLAALFAAVVTEGRLDRYTAGATPTTTPGGGPASVSTVFTDRTVQYALLGSGLQLFTAAALLSWMPSFFHRYYALTSAQATGIAAGVVLLMGVGMVVCGAVSDRVARFDPARTWSAAVVFCTLALIFLTVGFGVDAGPVQVVLIAAGAFFAAGSSGPAAAMIARLTHSSVRASAMGMLTVANNLLGLALGPVVVGVLADHLGLLAALQIAPPVYVAAIAALVLGRRRYLAADRRPATAEPATDDPRVVRNG